MTAGGYRTGWERPSGAKWGCLLLLLSFVLDLFLAYQVYLRLDPEFPLRTKFILWAVVRTCLWAGLLVFVLRGIGAVRLVLLTIAAVGLAMLFASQWAMFRPSAPGLAVATGLKTTAFVLLFLPASNRWFRQMGRWAPPR